MGFPHSQAPVQKASDGLRWLASWPASFLANYDKQAKDAYEGKFHCRVVIHDDGHSPYIWQEPTHH